MKKRMTLYKGVRMIEPDDGSIRSRDLLIGADENEEPVILAVEDHIDDMALKAREVRANKGIVSVVKGDNNYLFPLFTDLAVTVREPGAMYIERLSETLNAATAGGFGQLLAFYPGDRRLPWQDVIDVIANHPSHRFFPLFPLSPDGKTLSNYSLLRNAGAVAVTDIYTPALADALLYEGMARAAEEGLAFFADACAPDLAARGAVHNGTVARMRRYAYMPSCAEDLAVARHLLFAAETGCRLHLSGLSRATSFDMVRRAKSAGLAVSCDVSPFHFSMTDMDVLYYGIRAKLYPPLRSESDRLAVIDALADGTVDAIASHHTPNEIERSGISLTNAPFGAASLETTFLAALNTLLFPASPAESKKLSLPRLLSLLSWNPAAILTSICPNLKPLTHPLAPGQGADFLLASLDGTIAVKTPFFRGKATNSPFLGRSFFGKILRVVVRGQETIL